MAKKIQPEFRTAALGEKYYACEVAFTGVATGYCKIVDLSLKEPEKRQITNADELEAEIDRFWDSYEQTVQKFEERLNAKQDHKLTSDEEEMIETIRGLVRGRATNYDIERRNKRGLPKAFREGLLAVSEGSNADFAIYEQLFKSYEKLKSVPSMKETAEELRDILTVFLQQYDPELYGDPFEHLGIEDIPVFETMSHGDVSNLVDMNGQLKVKACLVDNTTRTSHAVLKAKSSNILLSWFPDVDRPKRIKNGTRIIIDGNNGAIIIGASDKTWEEYKELEEKYKRGYETLKAKWKDKRKVPTLDEREFKNYINGDTPATALAVKEYGAQGMGLIRLEGYLDSLPEHQRNLSVKDWYNYIDTMVNNADRATLVFRLLDVVGDKAMNGFTPDVVAETDKKFMTAFLQYRADHGLKKLQLMVPNVKTSADLDNKQIVLDTAAEINGIEGYKLGSMDEHPDFNESLEADEIDASFLSTGSNDMTAAALEIDRFDEGQADDLDQTAPIALKHIHWPLTYQRKVGGPKALPVSICGDMASQPENFALLAGMGYRRLSMAPAILPVIKELQNRIDTGYRFRLLREIDIEKYKELQKEAQQDDHPDNAWALLQRVRVEENREKRTSIIQEYNKNYLGLDEHNRIDLHWKPPQADLAILRAPYPASRPA